VDGTRAVTVNLWPDATTAGTPLCQTVASTTSIVGGRFRIALASSCKTAINQNNNAYVEVIDGATSLGRTPIGAVPYAVEADHAASADNATTAATAQAAGGTLAQQVVPSGAVMAFNLSACPTGWSALAAAGGRTIIGVNPAGGNGLSTRNLGDTVGEETHTQTISEMPSHTHTLASGDVVSGMGGELPYISANAASATFAATSGEAGGGSPFNQMQPSLALLYCQKN
jgi:hypothetical protein